MTSITIQRRIESEMAQTLTDLRTVLDKETDSQTVNEVYYLARYVVDLVHDGKKLTNAMKTLDKLNSRYGR